MDETDQQRRYREEARVLGEIGLVLGRTDLPRVTVRLPAALANAAVDAWERAAEGQPGDESLERRLLRHRAGTLGLIGLAVQQRGRFDGEEVVVDLSPDLIGIAVDAADDVPA